MNVSWNYIDGKYYLFVNGTNSGISYTHVENLDNGCFKVSENSKYGVLDQKGQVIIPLEYDILRLENIEDNKFYLCGRDGIIFEGKEGFFSMGELKTVYTGVYDLRNSDGELLLGGFDHYRYEPSIGMFFFMIGRRWRTQQEDKKSFKQSSFTINDSSARWIVLNRDFFLPYKFEASKEIENRILDYGMRGFCLEEGRMTFKAWNEIIPSQILMESYKITKGHLIVTDRFGSRQIFYNNKNISSYYKKIIPIDDNFSFVYDGKLGIIRNGGLIIPCKYEYITYPVRNWVILLQRLGGWPDCTELCNTFCAQIANISKGISTEQFRLVSMNIRREKIEELLKMGAFLLHPTDANVPESDIKSVALDEETINYDFISDELKKEIGKIDYSEFPGDVYWMSTWRVKDMMKPPKSYSSEEHYSMLDALDGDYEAYWNID